MFKPQRHHQFLDKPEAIEYDPDTSGGTTIT
jgi:hypothetical protein